MKYLFFILLIPHLVFSQDYKSVIIPFNENATPSEITTVEDSFILPVLYLVDGALTSAYIMIDDNLDTVFTKSYTDFSVGLKEPVQIGFNYYQFVKNNIDTRYMSLIKMNSAFDLLEATDQNSESNINSSNTFSKKNEFIYGVVSDIFEDPDRRQLLVKKIDTLGNEEWSTIIGEEEPYTNASESCISASGLIAISSDHRVNFQSLGQLHLLNDEGNIIELYQDDDIMKSSGVGQWIACLDNEQFVLFTKVDRRIDPKYIMNNWDGYPPKVSLINNDGELIKEILLPSPSGESLNGRFVESGKGNYFFGGGYRRNQDPYKGDYGWLYKMDVEGNMIWNRIYHHPKLANQDYYHSIIDIIELDNGDILTLGSIRKPLENNRIWIQILSPDGCFTDENCGIILSTSVAEALANEIKIFPNPSHSEFNIKASFDIKKIIVYNVYGDVISLDSGDINLLDLGQFPSGMYYVRIFDKSSKSAIKKIIKL